MLAEEGDHRRRVLAEARTAQPRGGEELAKLGPGQYFGELALIDEGTRTATITADSDLKCYGLTSWEFRPLVEGNSHIAWKLLQALAKQLREARDS